MRARANGQSCGRIALYQRRRRYDHAIHGRGLQGVQVRYQVLGPVQAWRDDGSLLDLGLSQRRVIFAVLLLRANRSLSREQLIDAVWGGDGPKYATNLLQKHISEEEVAAARSARASGELRAAAETLHRALQRWHGMAFGGLASPLLDAQRTIRQRQDRCRAPHPNLRQARRALRHRTIPPVSR